MTVQSTTRTVTHAGTGATGPFSIPFRFYNNTHITAYKIVDATGVTTSLAETTDYTLTGAGDPTGELTLLVALAVGETLLIERVVPLTQQTDISDIGFTPRVVETRFDLVYHALQQLSDDLPLTTAYASAAALESAEPASEANAGKIRRVKDGSDPAVWYGCDQNADNSWSWEQLHVWGF